MSMSWSVCRSDTPHSALPWEPCEMCLGKLGAWNGEGISKEDLVRSTAWVRGRCLQGEKGQVYTHLVVYSS